MAEAEFRLFYEIGDRLGLTIGQVMEMPMEEVAGWAAYFDHRAKGARHSGR